MLPSTLATGHTQSKIAGNDTDRHQILDNVKSGNVGIQFYPGGLRFFFLMRK